MKRTPEVDSVSGLARSGAWLMTSHLVSMSIGLLGLPILMTALGPLQFGSWAVLLGGTFAFATLELGMSSAVMRWTILAMMSDPQTSGQEAVSEILSNSLVSTGLTFALVGIPLFAFAVPLANWLNLPETPLLSAGECIMLVYSTAAILALLRCTIAPLLATRRMATHAGFTLLQSAVGAGATWTVAVTTKRLDLVLIANTLAIISVQSTVAFYTRHLVPWRFELRRLDRTLAWAMLGYGAALQFSSFSGFVMYQFDKLMISAVVSPTEVAHYEIASRSAQALGNISNAPLIAFAPALTERHDRTEDMRSELLRMLRMTTIGVGVFLLLPLAISPIGLFAWVGQIGYHATKVFALLSLSVFITTLTWPLSMCAQAKGLASTEMWRAVAAMLINIPFAFVLIHALGKEGAALGTLLACLVANTVFAVWLFRLLDLRWMQAWRALSPLLAPIASVAMVIALLAQVTLPLVVASRWYMAPMAAALYAVGLLALLKWMALSRALGKEEISLMQRVPILGRLFAAA